MPHLIANRKRYHDLTKAHPEIRDQFRWETINTAVYLLGGVVFIIGSVLFFPKFSNYSDVGAWTFIVGSLLFLIVNVHDFAEVLRSRKINQLPTKGDGIEAISTMVYLVGTLFFVAGSVFFLSKFEMVKAGAWCFIIGSMGFLIGASINVLQIVAQNSLVSLQLVNLTAISFVVGSAIFAIGSVPYLWTLQDAYDRNLVLTFLAWLFVIGSALFLLGGVFNYWRAYLIMRHEATGLPQEK
jgi:hypothetical protein